MGNQEESQKGRGLNREDQMTAGIVGNQGIKRKIARLERKMKGKSKMETRRQIW